MRVGFTIVAFSFYNLSWITSNDEKCKCYLSRYRKMVLGVFLYLVGWLYVTLLLLQRFFGIERLQIFTSSKAENLHLFKSILLAKSVFKILKGMIPCSWNILCWNVHYLYLNKGWAWETFEIILYSEIFSNTKTKVIRI